MTYAAEAAMAQAVASEAKVATYGWDGASDPGLFENAVAADTMIATWTQSEADTRRRRDTTMEVMTRDIDEIHIRRALSSLGFRRQAKRAVLAVAVTNTLWCGSRADIKDVTPVALALMRDDIELRAIRPIPGGGAAKGRALVRAGAAGEVAHLARMTPAEAAAMRLPLPRVIQPPAAAASRGLCSEPDASAPS